MPRNITAIRKEVAHELAYAALESKTCEVLYKKWDVEKKRFVRHHYEVVPIDANVNSRGNIVIYVQDVRDNDQTKMFIRDHIDSVKMTDRTVTTLFPIRMNNIQKYLGRIGRDDLPIAASDGRVGLRMRAAGELLRIAQRIMEFSGAEAFKDDGESYDAVGDDGRG